MVHIRGFPGGSVIKNPPMSPANAGSTGSIPDLGRSHMPWSSHNYWSLCILEPVPCYKRNHHGQWEAHALQVEKSLCSNEDPTQPRINKVLLRNITPSHNNPNKISPAGQNPHTSQRSELRLSGLSLGCSSHQNQPIQHPRSSKQSFHSQGAAS